MTSQQAAKLIDKLCANSKEAELHCKYYAGQYGERSRDSYVVIVRDERGERVTITDPHYAD